MPDTDRTPDARELLAHAGWVQRLARQLVPDEHRAADVAQDALVAALERPPALAGLRLRRWLGGVVRHVARGTRRRELERAGREREATLREPAPDPTPAERLELQRRLVEAVLALEEPYRATLVARYFDDLAPAEIARRRGVPAGTVRSWHARGLAALRAELDRRSPGGRDAWCAALATLVPRSRRTMTHAGRLALAAGLGGAAVVLAAFGVALSPTGARPQAVPSVPTSSPDLRASAFQPATNAAQGARAERTAVLDDPVAREELVLRVEDEDGAPLADARVFAVAPDTGDRRIDARTDEHGVVRTAAEERAVVVVAVAAGHAPAWVSLDVLSGERVLTLRRSVPLTGRAVDRHGAPVADAPLRLVYGDPLAGVPSSARAALEDTFPREPIESRTDEDGAFGFEVAPDWSGGLLPILHWIVGASDGTPSDRRTRLDLSGARTHLELVLAPHPRLRGRLVWADTREPIAADGINAFPVYPDDSGKGGAIVGARVDADGRFEVPILRWHSPLEVVEQEGLRGITGVRLRVGPHPGLANEWIWIERDRISADGDLGDVLLTRVPSFSLRVRDAGGNLLAGAYARSAGPIAGPSDEEGHLVVPGAADSGRVSVGAPGCFVRTVACPAAGVGADALDVRLEPSARLEIRVVDSGGTPMPEAFVQLDSPVELYATPERENEYALPSSLLWSYCAGRHSSGSSRHGVTEIRFQCDAFGRLDLDGLSPGVDLSLTVRGPLGRPLAEARVRTPDRGERLPIELVADAPTFELALRIVDDAGRGLHAAEIELSDERGSRNARTDADGRAVVLLPDDVGELQLEVSHRGHVARRLEGVQVDRRGAPLEIALPTGRTVRARVQDEDGRVLHPEAVILCPEDGPMVWAETLDGQEFVLSAVPDGVVPVEVRLAYERYAFTHDASLPEATLVLPPHGWLELALAESLALEIGSGYVSLHRVDDDVDLLETMFNPDARPLRSGRYEVRLERRWWEDGTRHVLPVGTPASFEIRPGETTRVVVGE